MDSRTIDAETVFSLWFTGARYPWKRDNLRWLSGVHSVMRTQRSSHDDSRLQQQDQLTQLGNKTQDSAHCLVVDVTTATSSKHLLQVIVNAVVKRC